MAEPLKQIRDDNERLDLSPDPVRPVSHDVGDQKDKDKAGGLVRARAADDLQGPSKADADAANGDTETAPKPNGIKDALDVVKDSFHWLNDAAQQHIETLRASLKKEDEPPLLVRLAETALEMALAAGAAGGGEYLAGKLLHTENDGLHELLKAFLEEGIGAGVAFGRSKIGGGGGDAVDPFIDSQKEGVRAMHMENQTKFTMEGRHRVRTDDDALALKEACNPANLRVAAKKQQDATRDAWVSYLAQSRFGSTRTGTTNMDTQEQRDHTLKKNPWKDVPADAPHLGEAMLGRTPGVLMIDARLPAISEGGMPGKPEINLAILNGLNEENRNEYLGSLDALHIPRQINARVDGKQANFSINLDETGIPAQLPDERSPQAEWLVARGGIGRKLSPGDEYDREERGLQALLHELVVTDIRGKLL